MATNFCPNCGNPITPGANFCLNCGNPLNPQSSTDERTHIVPSMDDPTQFTQPQQFNAPYTPYPNHPQKKSNILTYILVVCIVLLVSVIAFFGFRYVSGDSAGANASDSTLTRNTDTSAIEAANVIPVPNTNQAFTACRLNLRSTPDNTVNYNYLATLDFGTGVSITGNQGLWSQVQVTSGPCTGAKGWVASHYILNPVNFEILKSILPDKTTRNVVKESYLRYALLQYFLEHKYIGNLSQSQLASMGMSDFKITNNNQWEVTRPYEVKTQRLVNASSRYPDFAVIIRNIRTGEEKLLYFTIDNSENSTLYREMPLTTKGTIVKIGLEPNGDIKPYVAG